MAKLKVGESDQKRNVQKEILKLPYLVLSVSMLLTIGTTFIFYKSAESKDTTRFQSETKEIKNRIDNKIVAYLAMIKAARGFVESTDDLNEAKFADFVNSLELVKNYSGVEGLGFVKKVLAKDKQAFIEKNRSPNSPNFNIFPENQHPEYYSVTYLEPQNERNHQALGYDMSTDEERLKAMKKACESGEPTASSRVILAQDLEASRPNGFLIYLPVYKNKKTPIDVEARHSNLEGYIYSPFRAESFLREVQNSTFISDIAVTIYEGEQRPENILAQTNNSSLTAEQDFRTTSDLDVAGQKWIIEFQSLPAFSQQSTTGWTSLIFLSGLVFSLLIFGMTYLETSARAKAEDIADELKESEREKGFLLESEQNERKRAEEASRAKDEFISIVSHELRTPLNSIAGWSKILQADNLADSTKKQALEKIDKNLRVQTDIVEELLDFSQILAVKSDVSFREIEFSPIFEKVFEEVSLLAQEKEIILIKENHLNGQRVLGNSERLQRVIKNLLINAIKFTPENGQVEAKVDATERIIQIVINDTGQGIKPEFLKHMFERFRQADSSTTRQHGGLGLGLAISSHIVKLHSGTIEAASEGENLGATFTVRLPIAKKNKPENKL